MTKPIIAAIAAIARNGAIGKDNKIPWHISEDFKHFKRTTMGKPMIVGRKTFESFGGKPLPGRPHIVISRTGQPDRADDNVFFVQDLDSAIAKANAIAADSGVDEIFICGGAQIYKEAFPLTQRFYLTLIDQDYDADTFLNLDFTGWNEVSRQDFPGPPPYQIRVMER